MNIKHKSNNKKTNKGLEILRFYLSFSVVASHSFIPSKNYKYINLLINNIHVPIFYIMSFYFFYKTLITRNIEKLIKRFQRLLIPYFIWPIIFFIINKLLNYIFKINIFISVKKLKNQLLTGTSFNPALWFQFNLILETFIFIFIEFLFNKYKSFILINIELSCYFAQYSYFNYQLFRELNFEMKYPFGRIAESLPYSISGFMLAHFSFISYLNKNTLKSIYILIFILLLVIKYNIFLNIMGFNYSGIKIQIISLCIFIIFSIIPINKIIKDDINFINQISKFSSGIYYLHFPVISYLERYIVLITKILYFIIK